MLLELENVSYFVNGCLLLSDINARINPGDKIGIVGRNGCGKSTLLDLLSQKIIPSAGAVKIAKNARVLTVRQDLPDSDISPLDWLRSVDTDLINLNKQLDEADEDAMGDLYDQIATIEEERYEKNGTQVLTGLGLMQAECESPMKNLSGGFRMRIALASVLLQKPDVVLLDEPTNHLDLESSLWFIAFMRNYDKAFVIVSHDKTLLNILTQKIFHIQSAELTSYSGNYNAFIEEYNLKRAQAQQSNEKIQDQQKHAQKFVDKFGALSSTASLAQSRLKLIDRLEKQKVTLVPEAPSIPIDFPAVLELSNPIIRLDNVTMRFENHTVFNPLEFEIKTNSRIGILGRNGSGKTTLVRLLTERLKPTSGNVHLTNSLRIGYFSQEQADELDLEKTVMQQLQAHNAQINAFAHLSHFGFKREKLACKIKDLSGGEKSRLLFAIISAQNPHLIIMDEPTNHLDIESREALIAAIQKFNGAIVLVSHDWQLMKNSMQEFMLVQDKKVVPYKKGILAYERELMKTLQLQKPKQTSTDKLFQAQPQAAAASASASAVKKLMR